MVAVLSKVRASTGEIPPDHRSHEHLNEQKEVPVRPGVIEKWAEEFQRIGEEREKRGEKVIWVLLDGFLLYWNRVSSCRRDRKIAAFQLFAQEVVNQIDVRVLLRAPHDVLRQRRLERHGYHTAGEQIL